MVRVGVNLPIRPEPGADRPGRFIADAAVLIEDLGFDGAWVADALGRGFPNADPLTALSIAATVTDRIELGTCVLQLPLRPAVEVAHRILTLDMLAPDRVTIGVGAGSTSSDFDAVAVPFDERFTRLSQGLDEVRAILAGEPVRGVTLTPWVERVPGPRILIGAWSKGSWIARAAHEFDGWIASAGKTDWETLETGLRRFRDLGGTRAIVVNLPVRIRDEDSADSPALVGTPGTIRERWERLLSLGFDDIVIAPRNHARDALAGVRELLGLGAPAAA
jgi:alkanesulfonate monooxygenase SsuD/methylene tetrahydromethanopterin reductase-like flavin-dependent oxidoreductase (luciferase family)